MAHRSTEYDAMLHDTVALIAYEEPEVGHPDNASVAIHNLAHHSTPYVHLGCGDCLPRQRM